MKQGEDKKKEIYTPVPPQRINPSEEPAKDDNKDVTEEAERTEQEESEKKPNS